MGQVILVEIVDKSGNVLTRSRHDHFPIRIGRAYNNDVIIDDKYVSPEHLNVEVGEDGNLSAVDLNSVNGTYLNQNKKITRTPLGLDDLLHIGHTTLRIRSTEYRVPEALKANLTSQVPIKLASNIWVFALILPLTASLLVWSVYWETYTTIKLPALLLPPSLILAMLMAWAGIWALASRIYAHRSSYFVHVVIACAVFIGILVLDILLEYYAFAFAAGISAEVLTYIVFTALATLLLFWHLRTFVQAKSKHIALGAGMIACTLAAVAWLSLHAALSRDTGKLEYNASLKPLAFKVSRSLSVEDFLAKISLLRSTTNKTSNP